ncbi:MAG TPA: CDF family Co(II)/Ni(II) efflux transporter DmeF [Smithella sp.]|nr:CDF family Co(II)/Ni(II) efflux transporter DmeF [Smithella sp.]MDM7988129.1 CDF family Co(II)/Ni(II) efflux transporter DmeF [Smithella sp.]HNY49191.1 CDF family Co(II)/Ni(II) efflux transporter DmeF [Smithella sp.]HOG90067.1 CDF family Co(II)/Ni(II) efflux transporter DmeF [Smithella sp.]HOU49637.1 CDF family Co(II)/Ni(II) efflux transporter DmeF [Smithella sp.]
MHDEQIELWQHHHLFNVDKKSVEKSTFMVVVITFITMVAEILFGWISNSMALLADGWHMGTHAFALGISLIAYIMARKYAKDRSFTFGTWKIEILGAYTSAIVLGLVGLIMIYTSIQRILHPLNIYYNQALLVAFIGLSVNIVCAIILNNGGHAHEHTHRHEENKHSHHEHHQEDLNLKSAYLHVVADALTSVLAIAALLGGKYFNFVWLDPFMGIVGAGLILHWSFLLLKETGSILLQREIDNPLADEIKNEIESDGDSIISDLHIWKVAQNKYACIVSLVTSKNCSIEDYKKRLAKVHELVHVTIEIHECKR